MQVGVPVTTRYTIPQIRHQTEAEDGPGGACGDACPRTLIHQRRWAGPPETSGWDRCDSLSLVQVSIEVRCSPLQLEQEWQRVDLMSDDSMIQEM